ncbi:hypothetical protein DYU11_05165 [Fibrisoma montanum]|uniref:Signal transduction histidine kinase internal region domain-containing protein n=1 Tax=Fibrisoma montanum TaxID=2305895 RepID=A0A418MJV9_9BACT|nr:hypothetical protein DYU11_05165 [Fibrisoma montanum]
MVVLDSTLKKDTAVTGTRPQPARRLLPRLTISPLWQRVALWAAIAGSAALLGWFTDFSAIEKGFNDGYADGRGIPQKTTGLPLSIYVGVVLVAAIIVGVLTGVAHLYYVIFHKRVFKSNQIAYIVLYVIWLFILYIGMSKLFTDAFGFDGNTYRMHQATNGTIKVSDYHREVSSTMALIILIYMVVYGFITDYRKGHKVQLALIQQKAQAELDALKAQVNPHFLFNSLNNIYGTALMEQSPRTAESIQQLSGIVRYVMEESRLQTTTIQRELRFIDDYVELQRIRIPDKAHIRIEVDMDWDEKPAQIVPLLLNPLIENAFKYGISIQNPCFVRIQLRVQDGTLYLLTENSILPRTDLEKGTGLGLANVRKRLELAYPDRHLLVAGEDGDVFRVSLTIRL